MHPDEFIDRYFSPVLLQSLMISDEHLLTKKVIGEQIHDPHYTFGFQSSLRFEQRIRLSKFIAF